MFSREFDEPEKIVIPGKFWKNLSCGRKCSSTGVRIDFWDRELEALSNAILWYYHAHCYKASTAVLRYAVRLMPLAVALSLRT